MEKVSKMMLQNDIATYELELPQKYNFKLYFNFVSRSLKSQFKVTQLVVSL